MAQTKQGEAKAPDLPTGQIDIQAPPISARLRAWETF